MNLDTILKEADKEFDSLWDRFDMDKPHNIKYFLHSQITKAYKAGQEDGRNKLLEELPDTQFLYGRFKQQTLKQIEEWADKEWVAPVGDVKLLHYEDLKKFINTL
jgi:hypothetical protein